MNRPAPKRLFYPGSKCVIQYLEVYKRHTLATRCPSLRPIHQLTPLIIDNLRLGSSYYTLNGFLHRFGAFNEETSQLELNITRDEHSNYAGLDVHDQYWGDDVDLEPSDVKLGIFPRVRWRQAQGIQGLLNGLMHMPNLELQEVVNQIADVANDPFYRPFGNQRFELPPRAIQHSRTLPGANARDAARNHLAKVLSRDTLVINLAILFDAGVVTMPAGYKFRVRDLSLDSDKFLVSLAPILEASTFRILKIRRITDTQQSARNPLLRASEILELGPARNLDWNSCIESFSNNEIHINNFLPTPAQFGNVARRWVRENRIVGTKLSVNASQIWGPRDAQELLERIRQELRGKWKSAPNRRGNEVPRWVVYPFDDRREIKIHGQPEPNLNVIVMEVVGLASAL